MLILCKKCAERCWNISFQRIRHQILNFQRIQHKSYIISAHSVDFLQNYPLAAADPSTRDNCNTFSILEKGYLLLSTKKEDWLLIDWIQLLVETVALKKTRPHKLISSF